MRNPRAEEKLTSIRNTHVPYVLRRGDIHLTITKNVYPTSELSELLVDVMDDSELGIKKGNTVLDYGSGTGFLALQAAKRGANVIAIDINKDAIACGQLNARNLHLKNKISFRCGVNLSPLKPYETFDIIFAGMPWDNEDVSDMLEHSVYDPGFKMRRALFESAERILKPKGRIVMSSSEEQNHRYPNLHRYSNLDFRIIRERNIKNALHYAVLVTLKT